MDSNKDKLGFGELIAQLRREKGYSQRKFAQLTGLSNATISRIENGETNNPGVETLKLLAAHLDYDEAKLMKLVEPDKSQNSPQKISARLKFLQQPVRRIKRYSTVCISDSPQEHIEVQEVAIIKESTVNEAPELLRKVTLKGMRLITLRMENNITQKDLADALCLDKTLISQYEGEIIKPDYGTVQKLADFFNVTVDYLIGEPKEEIVAVEEPEILYHEEKSNQASDSLGIEPEYISIAKEIQDAGIEIEDVRAFIRMIGKYKRI